VHGMQCMPGVHVNRWTSGLDLRLMTGLVAGNKALLPVHWDWGLGSSIPPKGLWPNWQWRYMNSWTNTGRLCGSA
jgi:hypothetical protein